MITVLTGTNSFEIDQALKKIIAQFDGTPEKVDGESLEVKQLPDLLMGSSLFAEKRLVIIKGLSQNSSVWEKLPEWMPRVSDDIHVVLVDEKLDKRTTTYKELKNGALVKEFSEWTDRDRSMAETWVIDQAKSLSLTLDKKRAHHLVERVGLDQWQLASALEKLSLLDEVSETTIDDAIEANPAENVFQLFELALDGHTKKVHDMLATLELTEEPYKLFALLSSQAFQLAAVAAAEEGAVPTKDFAIHPFVASKLSRHAKKLGKTGARRIVQAFARADADMKLSKADPWLLIERALISAAR